MQRNILILITALLALCANASDKNTVVVPKQFTKGQSSIIPEKTDYLKLQNIAFNRRGEQQGLIAALQPVLDSIVSTNYELPFFSLTISPMVAGGTRVEIASYDVMQEPAAARKLLYGVLKIRNCYFIVKNAVTTTADNILLLQQMWTNASGKTRFERIFELVTDPVHYGGTKYVGLYKNGHITPSTFIVNGEDLLHPQPTEPQAYPDEPQATNNTGVQ